jgi:alkylation response protein AidB-like acyl-CoA dehydrogenase
MAEATLEAVRDASELIRSEAEATEAAGRLTDRVVAAIRDAGVYRMTMSKEFGGPELDPLQQLDVLEELSAADGSAGWCGMINSDGGYVTAFLDRDVARKMYPSLDMPTAVVAAPGGQAVVGGDTFTVTGQWAFASGSHQADWIWLNAILVDEAGNMSFTQGLPMPDTRVCAVPAAQVEILDTWHTTGLQGTGSNDVRVANAVVPREQTFSLFDGDPVDPAPLYKLRWMFFVNMAAVPLGVMRAMLTEAKQVAEAKVVMPAMTFARDDASVQLSIGRAEALARSARAYVYDTVGAVWDAVLAGRLPNSAEWIDYRLALTNAMHAGKQAAGLIYEALGTTGVYRKSPLDRQLRDLTTMAQHMLTQTKNYGYAGRVLLGLESGGLAFEL